MMILMPVDPADRARPGPLADRRFEQAPVALLVADTDGAVIAANACWRRLAGLDGTSVLGAGWLAAVPDEDRGDVAAAWTSAIGSGGRFRHHLGATTVDVEVSVVRDEDGAVVEHLAAFAEVPAQVRGDTGPVVASLRFLADRLPQLIATSDSAGIADYVNRPFVDYTGLTLEDIRVKGLREALHPDDRPYAVEQWRRGLVTGRGFEHVSRVRSARDGSHRWFVCISLPQTDGDGRVVRWFVTLTDIDEHKRAEDLLTAERRRLYQLLGAAPAVITVRRGPELRLEFANEHARRVLSDGLLGGTDVAQSPDDPLGTTRRVFDTGERYVAFEQPARMPWRDTGPSERYFNVVRTPMRELDGTIEGVVSFAFDVTTQVLARQRAEALAEDLRKAVRSRDDFLSIAGHELKTPLAALQLQVQGLQRILRRGGEIDAPRFSERLDKAVAHLGRLERLVDELLDVARIAAGRITFTFEEVDLLALASEIAERFVDELARSGSTLVVEGDAPVVGRWDRLRVDQVLTNLVSNAVKYGGGKPIAIDVRGDGTRAQVAVRDRGVGIAAADQTRLFGRFERAVSGRSAGGLGLGLWITRRFVEAMGGQVAFSSELGQGSTFTVELPQELAGP